jgi:hypothetical protein
MKLAQKAVEAFAREHEDELISERMRLGRKLVDIVRENDGGYTLDVKVLGEIVEQIEDTLEKICSKSGHMYDKITSDFRKQTFVCKRCGYQYSRVFDSLTDN